MHQFLKSFNFLFLTLVIAGFCQKDKISATSSGSDIEYFYGNTLRDKDLTCKDELLQIICFNRCGITYVCNKNKCICRKQLDHHRSTKETKNMRVRNINEINKLQDHYFLTYIDRKNDNSNELVDLSQSKDRTWNEINDKKNVNSNELMEMTRVLKNIAEQNKPGDLAVKQHLRHHIAHFCPDLEEARKCIRSCMKVGKPAFCGKDHVCYCGHKYNSHDEEKPLNLDDQYAEFRDLYEKYFGPRSDSSDQDSEE